MTKYKKPLLDRPGKTWCLSLPRFGTSCVHASVLSINLSKAVSCELSHVTFFQSQSYVQLGYLNHIMLLLCGFQGQEVSFPMVFAASCVLRRINERKMISWLVTGWSCSSSTMDFLCFFCRILLACGQGSCYPNIPKYSDTGAPQSVAGRRG